VRDDIARGQLFGFYHQMGAPTIQSMQIVEQGTGDGRPELRVADDECDDARAVAHLVDSPLETGKTYNLWLAFTKPMRWRNGEQCDRELSRGRASRSPPPSRSRAQGDGGAPVNISVPTSTSSWKDLPGGAPTGFLNYKDDSAGRDVHRVWERCRSRRLRR
jgi:hypothetical protein